MHISRRRFTGCTLGALAIAASPLGWFGDRETKVEDVRQLKPANTCGIPARAAGPMAIVVSLPDQLVYVYRDGIRIAVSTCATGRPGHETPTGVVHDPAKTPTATTGARTTTPDAVHRAPHLVKAAAPRAGNLPGYPTPTVACIRRSSSRSCCFDETR